MTYKLFKIERVKITSLRMVSNNYLEPVFQLQVCAPGPYIPSEVLFLFSPPHISR